MVRRAGGSGRWVVGRKRAGRVPRSLHSMTLIMRWRLCCCGGGCGGCGCCYAAAAAAAAVARTQNIIERRSSEARCGIPWVSEKETLPSKQE